MCSTQSLIVSNFLEKFSIFIERFSKFEQDFPNVNKIFQFFFLCAQLKVSWCQNSLTNFPYLLKDFPNLNKMFKICTSLYDPRTYLGYDDRCPFRSFMKPNLICFFTNIIYSNFCHEDGDPKVGYQSNSNKDIKY